MKTTGNRSDMYFLITFAVMLFSLFMMPRSVVAQFWPGDDVITEVTFNPAYISGRVSAGDLDACTVKMVKAKIWASGKDPHSGTNLPHGPVWADPGDNFRYELPVHVPCKRDEIGICTGTPVETQGYDVSCVVYYSNTGRSYLRFKNQHADVSYKNTTPLHFTMNPGYICGTLPSLYDTTLTGGYIHATLNADGKYVNTRIEVGPDGYFRFPVQAYPNIKLSAGIRTTAGSLELESQYLDVEAGEETCVNFTLNAGYISGKVSIGSGLTLTEGRIHADLNADGKYVNAGTNLAVSGSEGTFSFPVQAYDHIKVSATAIKTTTGNYYNLENRYADVAPMNTTTVNWIFDPTSLITGNFILNGLGTNTVDSHRISARGPVGGKGTSLSDNGAYALTYLIPGVYTVYADSSLNGGDDYFRHPYANFARSVTVPDDTEVTNHVASDGAFIDGKIIFKEPWTVVSVTDANSAKIYGYGVNGTETAGGYTIDKVDVGTTDQENYNLIVSEGSWNVTRTAFHFDQEQISLCGHDPVYLKSDLNVTDNVQTSAYGNAVSVSASERVIHDITYETGAVTLLFKVRDGDKLRKPWMKGASKVKMVYDGVLKNDYDIKVEAKGPPTETTEGEATFIGVPGWYQVEAGAVFNGASVSFGHQGTYKERAARSKKRDDRDSERGIEVVAGEHKTVHVDVYPPTLTLESPNAVCRSFPDEMITVSGTATDDIGGVASVTVNGESVEVVSTSNPDDPHEVFFTVQVPMDFDTNAIQVVAKDAYGKVASETRYIYTAGVFTVGASGIVSVDYLYDGGMYEGELGIFSLEGMEKLVPNSGLFMEEAARRALTNSPAYGYVVLSDQTEGARLSGPLGSGGEEHDWNKGSYKLRRFRMRPGDQFATILIPNDTLQTFHEHPDTQDSEKQPLFSLASSNPDFGLCFGQIADVDGEGNAFLFEDWPASRSDWDYNDLIVQITGVTACAPTLDNPDIQLAYDWRDLGLGEELTDHIHVSPPDENTSWVRITLKSPADLFIYDPEGRLIGKEGGSIPGATFEIDENGHQIVSLPALDEGEYRIVLRAIGDGGLCHLEIEGFQGDAKLMSQEEPFVIGPQEVFKTTVSGASFLDTGRITFPAPTKTPECDLNGDGSCNETDIERVSALWNICEGDPGWNPAIDLDGDGCVTILDIMRVVNGR